MSVDQCEPYDDSPWTSAETGVLTGEAFSKLDDTDYGDYLGNRRDPLSPNPD